MAELTHLTAHELTDAYRAGATTPSAVIDAYLARVAALDDRVHAYVTVTADQARAAAAASDARYRAGKPLGPLDGVPISYKDVLSTRGVKTTCGSKILASWVPPFDATVVTRLGAA